MLWTLQWYICRELGKTFLLTAVGITAVLGLGGGVFNMIGLQNAGAGQLLRLMTIVVPPAATLALPIAALFSAAVTYGRFSADNELVACRASGINVHWLFLPTAAVSLVTALLTFVSINYVIPERFRNLDQFVRADLSQIVLRQLQAPQRLKLGGERWRIYAENPRAVEDGRLPEDSEMLLLRGVAFAEMDQDDWVRYGTAETVSIRFDNLDAEPSVQVDFHGLTLFDRHRGWMESQHEPVRQERLPTKYRLKVKWLDLGELFHYYRHVEELPEVRSHLERLRALAQRERFYRRLERDFAQPDATGQPDCELTLRGDKDVGLTIRLQAESMTPDLYDRKPTFSNVRVTETDGHRTRTLTAGGATITVSERDGIARLELVGSVTLAEADDPGNPITRDRETIAGIAPAGEEAPAISDSELLDPNGTVATAAGFTKKRAKFLKERAGALRQIVAVIHSRLAFSISTFVLVILGAALGIVFRGSHVLTAFGISFVPSLLVIVTIIMGRQLAQNAGTTALGLAVIWGGIILVGAMDVWTLTRLVKR